MFLEEETKWRPDWEQSHFADLKLVSLFIEIVVEHEGWYKVKNKGTYLVFQDGDYYTVLFWAGRNGRRMLSELCDYPWYAEPHQGIGLDDEGSEVHLD